MLIDTGATLHGYNSDITHSYVFGEVENRQREIRALAKADRAAACDAAQIGSVCSSPDDAVRRVVEAAGFGSGYRVPGIS